MTSRNRPATAAKRRIKISLINQRFEYYKYGDTYTALPVPESAFPHPDFPHYTEQLAFDQALASHPEFALDGYGMPPEQFDATLQRLRLAVVGFELQPAPHIPALDDPCGQPHLPRFHQMRLNPKSTPAYPTCPNSLTPITHSPRLPCTLSTR